MVHSRRLFSLFLMLVLLLSIASPTLASENSAQDSSTRSEERVIKSFRITENGIVELTANDLADLALLSKKESAQKGLLRNNLSITKDYNTYGLITPMAPSFCGTSCTWAVYKEYNRPPTLVSNMKKRITPAVQGGPVTFIASGTFEKSVNISLTGIIKDAFEATIGAEWAKSSTVGMELQVQGPSNQYTWYEFTPMMYNSYGWTATYENSYYTGYKDKEIKNEWTDIYMTKLAGKWQDGVYTLVTSPNPPTN